MKKLFLVLALSGCSSLPPAHTVEIDLCEARAGYKLIELASEGKLGPAPDSPQAKIEAATDALCDTLKP
jgi:hypothetical protein